MYMTLAVPFWGLGDQSTSSEVAGHAQSHVVLLGRWSWLLCRPGNTATHPLQLLQVKLPPQTRKSHCMSNLNLHVGNTTAMCHTSNSTSLGTRPFSWGARSGSETTILLGPRAPQTAHVHPHHTHSLSRFRRVSIILQGCSYTSGRVLLLPLRYSYPQKDGSTSVSDCRRVPVLCRYFPSALRIMHSPDSL